jgi:hypothetical protein
MMAVTRFVWSYRLTALFLLAVLITVMVLEAS